MDIFPVKLGVVNVCLLYNLKQKRVVNVCLLYNLKTEHRVVYVRLFNNLKTVFDGVAYIIIIIIISF